MDLKINSLLVEADVLYKRGEFDKADSIYTGIIKQNPNNYEAVITLGRIKLL